MDVLISTVLVWIGFAAIGYGVWLWFAVYVFTDDLSIPVTIGDLLKVAAAAAGTLVGVIILTAKYIIAA